MSTTSPLDIYQQLFASYGPQHWWPGDEPFEVMVGAVLVQNTAWKNVEKAICNLKESGLFDPHALLGIPIEELQQLLRPAGYFRLKATRLRNLLRFVVQEYGGCLDSMFATDLATLRQQLLRINGIGPETADSILLYAGGLPTFVVDTYTQRVFKRHGWIEPEADYHSVKEHFEHYIPIDIDLYNEYHALLVRVGHLHCRKSPKCENCPLASLLPESGPINCL